MENKKNSDDINNLINETKKLSISNKIDIMEIIEKEDLELLNNKRIYEMSRMDWGKTMAISNQYIQRNILKKNLEKFNYKVYSTDDKDLPTKINTMNNSPGYDIIVITPNKKTVRIQSKLRQVKGINDYSQQVHFETTRRNSKKN
mgnify:FL=1